MKKNASKYIILALIFVVLFELNCNGINSEQNDGDNNSRSDGQIKLDYAKLSNYLKTIVATFGRNEQIYEAFDVLKSKLASFYRLLSAKNNSSSSSSSSIESLNYEQLLNEWLTKLNKRGKKIESIIRAVSALNLDPYLSNANVRKIFAQFSESIDFLDVANSLDPQRLLDYVLSTSFVPSDLDLSEPNLNKAFDILSGTLQLDKIVEKIDNWLAMFSIFNQIDPEPFLNGLSTEFFNEQFAKLNPQTRKSHLNQSKLKSEKKNGSKSSQKPSAKDARRSVVDDESNNKEMRNEGQTSDEEIQEISAYEDAFVNEKQEL